MKNIILPILILYFTLCTITRPVFAQVAINGLSAGANISSPKEDHREQILNQFFKKYHSPLADYSGEFIAAADFYDIDWRLVPAITGTESTFGKHIPYGSFNAYGWNNGNYRFNSWKESIWHVNKVLRTRYFDRGIDTVAKIGRVYAPPSGSWANNTQFFINKLDKASRLHFDI